MKKKIYVAGKWASVAATPFWIYWIRPWEREKGILDKILPDLCVAWITTWRNIGAVPDFIGPGWQAATSSTRDGPKGALCLLFVPLRLSTVFSCGKMFNFVNLVHKLLNFFSLRMIRAINSPLNNKTSLRLFHTKSFLENLLKVSFKYI